jgi:hypothetical protein
MISSRTFLAMAVGVALSGTAGTAALSADEPAIVLVLDEDAIDTGQAPNYFSVADLNATLSSESLRDQLPYFAANVGGHLTLPMGPAEDAGWFTFSGAPASWAEQETDGFHNLLAATPGLGSPDANGSTSSLLVDVPGMKVLSADSLQAIGEQPICALVFDGDVTTSETGGNLEGATLGIAAFRALSVSPEGVEIEVLDASTVCAGVLGSPTSAEPAGD